MSEVNAYIPKEWEEVDCPFCGASDESLYERFGSAMQYTYVKCNKCSVIYSSPRPKYDKDFVERAYASYYQFADTVTEPDWQNTKQSSLQMFEKEIEHLIQYDKQRTAALDIGSGMGTFLYAAKKYYQTAIGLDVSVKMAEFVKKQLGIDVIVAEFENYTPEKKFSLIHMSHVMEHIPNPNEWLQHAKELLIPNGILVINVPHKYSLGNRLQHFYYKLKLKKQFSSYWNDAGRTPDHLVEPTLKSMKLLVEKNGYKIIDFYTYSRKDPASNGNIYSKLINRVLKIGSNISFIVTPK
jgi:SAM-dependent methyltransferase